MILMTANMNKIFAKKEITIIIFVRAIAILLTTSVLVPSQMTALEE